MMQLNHDLHSVGELRRCQTQGFGSNPDVYGPGGHNGLDFSYEEGTELFSPVSGFAYYKEESAGYGKYLTIVGEGYKVVYAHLKERLIPDGQVLKGQLIAKGDSTGFSTGNHLHITVKRVDNNGNVLDRDNGTDGAIDPTSLLVWFMNNLVMVEGQKDIWLVKDDKRSLVYNLIAFNLLGGNIDQVQKLTQVQLDAIPDSGLVLAGLPQE